MSEQQPESTQGPAADMSPSAFAAWAQTEEGKAQLGELPPAPAAPEATPAPETPTTPPATPEPAAQPRRVRLADDLEISPEDLANEESEAVKKLRERLTGVDRPRELTPEERRAAVEQQLGPYFNYFRDNGLLTFNPTKNVWEETDRLRAFRAFQASGATPPAAPTAPTTDPRLERLKALRETIATGETEEERTAAQLDYLDLHAQLTQEQAEAKVLARLDRREAERQQANTVRLVEDAVQGALNRHKEDLVDPMTGQPDPGLVEDVREMAYSAIAREKNLQAGPTVIERFAARQKQARTAIVAATAKPTPAAAPPASPQFSGGAPGAAPAEIPVDPARPFSARSYAEWAAGPGRNL